jgi:hypothetical protein
MIGGCPKGIGDYEKTYGHGVCYYLLLFAIIVIGRKE